ncbi:beta-amylase 3, chloroplastic [Canna indica]|uniref:Beta-amylase n=1 Tax=Canna indica TaxID=4628 RepID=A0AAQ3KS77_9LILI|nr:beta-amylase 3, chloroplastic [Canna indica]
MLIQQVKQVAVAVGAKLAGEKAFERYDEGAYKQVLAATIGDGVGLSAFKYLRMNKRLFESENWRRFVTFVKSMTEGGRWEAPLPKKDCGHSDLYVGFIAGSFNSKNEAATRVFRQHES